MSILITGGTGSFGRAMVERLLTTEHGNRWRRIIIYSRGEHAQAEMARQLAPLDSAGRLRFFIGDVRDRDRLRRAFQGVEVVLHAAALKRIEVGEYNPIEMVKTNVDGSINVVEAAHDARVQKVVYLSTDKAWQPISPYGQSKALAESILLKAYQGGTRFAVTRYGNVWKSAGSVVPVWQSQVARGAAITITNPEATRFFMTMPQAVNFVLQAVELMDKGDLLIPELPAYRLGDLAMAISPGSPREVVTGLPPWEKLHEGMSEDNTSDKARRMTIEELRAALDERL